MYLLENRMFLSSFQMVWTDLQKVRFSNESCIWMSGFRIPTVFTISMKISTQIKCADADFSTEKFAQVDGDVKFFM